MQVSFLGHTKDDAEGKIIQKQTVTTTELTETTTIAEPPLQFHTTRDSVRDLKTLEKSLAFKYILRVVKQ